MGLDLRDDKSRAKIVIERTSSPFCSCEKQRLCFEAKPRNYVIHR